VWVVGEKEAGGGNRFPNRSMGVQAAIEPVVRLSVQRCVGVGSESVALLRNCGLWLLFSKGNGGNSSTNLEQIKNTNRSRTE
jgi:hypothetical protein